MASNEFAIRAGLAGRRAGRAFSKARQIQRAEGVRGVLDRARQRARKFSGAGAMSIPSLPQLPPASTAWPSSFAILRGAGGEDRARHYVAIAETLAIAALDLLDADPGDPVSMQQLGSMLLVCGTPDPSVLRKVVTEAARLDQPILVDITDWALGPRLHPALERARCILVPNSELVNQRHSASSQFVVQDGLPGDMTRWLTGLAADPASQPIQAIDEAGILVSWIVAPDEQSSDIGYMLTDALERHPHVYLEVIGTRTIPEPLRRHAGRIRAIGPVWRGERFRHLARAGIVIDSASGADLTPCLDALALGRPIIATSPLVQGIVVEQETGRLCLSPEDAGVALEELIESRDARVLLGGAAQAHARQWAPSAKPADQFRIVLSALSGGR